MTEDYLLPDSAAGPWPMPVETPAERLARVVEEGLAAKRSASDRVPTVSVDADPWMEIA